MKWRINKFFYFCAQFKLKEKGQNVKNQNVESPKADQKFEKDQNIKSQIILSTFWSFLTPYVISERRKSNLKVNFLMFWFYLWYQKRSERQKYNLSYFQTLTKWFLVINYLWWKYLWHFGIKKIILKNFLTCLNLT